MRSLRIAERAKRDLAFIVDYTHTVWGRAQAQRYLAEIEAGFFLLLAFPEAGRRRDDVRAGCRSLLKAHHVIYYELNGDFVDVIGVLHERMDPVTQFEGSP
ncbi:MAG: type II toxin-antitoxin system RelE/ParE family toxin [Alphaproteobacteria bacterium]